VSLDPLNLLGLGCDVSQISRRDLVGVAGTSLLVPSLARAFPTLKALRVAHMTDFHVQPEPNATKGMEAALHHAQLMVDRIDDKGVSCLCGGRGLRELVERRIQGFESGYRMLDLYPNGKFDVSYVAWVEMSTNRPGL